MRTLKKGDQGAEVVTLQKALHLYPDGIFGEITKNAVTAFQKAHPQECGEADGVVGAKTWAALGVIESDGLNYSTKRKITEIIVHCSATREGVNQTVAQIRKYHVEQRGWSDVGYHYVVYLDGSVHEGRPLGKAGAHCTGHNQNSIGVCYVGGCASDGKTPKDTRTDAQKAGLLKLIKRLKAEYPQATVHGHYEFARKACPCFNAFKEYRDV